jgi:hypothetical protein
MSSSSPVAVQSANVLLICGLVALEDMAELTGSLEKVVFGFGKVDFGFAFWLDNWGLFVG